jgi:predicted nuclease with RNAse H fold
MSGRWVGIDLGASRIDAVEIAASGAPARAAVRRATTFAADDLDAVVAFAAGANGIAIDAPSELSTAPHRDDAQVNRKFRTARCGEIALGEEARIWVPWVTPTDWSTAPEWMRVGFRVWHALRGAGHEPIEVYPTGAFLTLARTRLQKKTTREGLEARLALLEPMVEHPPMAGMWTHDGVDALVAAVTARHQAGGIARRHGHPDAACDGSAVWLPAVGAASPP